MQLLLKRIFTIGTALLGLMLWATGLYFQSMHWPDMFGGIYSGPFFLVLAVIIFFIERKYSPFNNL